ncbi:MAG TPA: hypothetical protein VFT83_00335, partial [Nitrososphaeraceae archaeon]|nr:hypothetical protein [Nitrososphaeraceae archaeon]
MVRNIFYSNYKNTADNKNIDQKKEKQKEIKLQREFMEKSVALSVHIKLKFEILSIADNIYKASFLQPLIKDRYLFKITKKGII